MMWSHWSSTVLKFWDLALSPESPQPVNNSPALSKGLDVCLAVLATALVTAVPFVMAFRERAYGQVSRSLLIFLACLVLAAVFQSMRLGFLQHLNKGRLAKPIVYLVFAFLYVLSGCLCVRVGFFLFPPDYKPAMHICGVLITLLYTSFAAFSSLPARFAAKETIFKLRLITLLMPFLALPLILNTWFPLLAVPGMAVFLSWQKRELKPES